MAILLQILTRHSIPPQHKETQTNISHSDKSVDPTMRIMELSSPLELMGRAIAFKIPFEPMGRAIAFKCYTKPMGKAIAFRPVAPGLAFPPMEC